MRFSNRIPASIFLIVYLFFATAGREFLKLPVLGEHYLDHVTENRNTCFYDYLLQHYFAEDGSDADAAEDAQLPFKSPENNTPSFTSIRPPGQYLPADAGWVLISNKFTTLQNTFFPCRYPDAIWQPPRSGSLL